jgi:HEAT repeat protein
VGQALARKLRDDNPMVRRFVLDALVTVGAKGLAKELTPLLGASDEEVREKAMRLLAAQGNGASEALARAVGEGPPAARKQAVALLVRVVDATAMDALLGQLGDHEVGEHVLQQLRAHVVDQGDPAAKSMLAGRVAAELKRVVGNKKKLAEESVPAAAALLRLAGYLAEPKMLGTLVAHAAKEFPPPVRLASIAGMRRLVAGVSGKAVDEAVGALIEWADDDDVSVARAAVDTLRGAHIPEKAVKAFTGLTKARIPEARRLATERLAALSGRAALPTLIDELTGADAGLREAAARSLAGAPEAAGPLLAALGEAQSDEVARRIVGVLRAHVDRLPGKALDALVAKVTARAGKEDAPVMGVLLDALALVAPEAHADLLLGRAQKLRKAGHAAEAFAALRPLAHSRAPLKDEQRFVIGVLGLRTSGKNLLRSARGVDPVLMQFAALVRNGFPVAKELGKQKDLDLEDLFTLGFNFIESQDEDEKGLGVELLELVQERQPRGKLAAAARNKLKLAGD